MRGGEKCLEVLCELYPKADLYTLLYVKDRLSESITGMNIRSSFVQKLPMASGYYRYYLPLFPTAIERFDLKRYDLVISTSHCVAKGVLPAPDALHISYCFTPMRYIWDMHSEYFEASDHKLKNLFISFFSNYLRLWDVTSSERVDDFIAISKHVQQRIKRFYRRESTIIYPPVNCDFFYPSPSADKKDDYYLMVTALAPYKRVDIAIEAFNRLGRSLLIIGDGQGLKSLQKRAQKNIAFLGWQSDEKVRSHYRGCQAFIFPGEEDFGIAPVEAQACGSPVIAYERGGVLESVIPFPKENSTGVFFHHPTAESLIQAVELFERNKDQFDPHQIRENALRFDKNRFRNEMKAFIDRRYQEFMKANRTSERG